MESRHKIYFGAGPAKLPQAVLEQAAAATLNYNGSGLSILELAHRDAPFVALLEESKALVKELCGIGNEYEVLWLQGGGRMQFAMVPMNFLGDGETAAYIDSGYWAHDALTTAQLYGNVHIAASSAAENYCHLPEWPGELPEGIAYVHCTTNNTIYGTQYQYLPHTGAPLVADMSSDIFGIERDYSQFDLFYAVAQKNIGPAGATLVVVRKEFLKQQKRKLAPILDYAAHAAAGSLLNTPPVAAIYTCLLTLRWLKEQGQEHIINCNQQKAALLYAEIERNALFACRVATDSRSVMNVVFQAKDAATETAFLERCSAHNIEGIKGHRSVGGFRASVYNATTIEEVQALVSVMQDMEG